MNPSELDLEFLRRLIMKTILIKIYAIFLMYFIPYIMVSLILSFTNLDTKYFGVSHWEEAIRFVYMTLCTIFSVMVLFQPDETKTKECI